MPRTLQISVPSEQTEALIADLREVGTLSLRLHRGASLQPAGDVVSADVTDRDLPAAAALAARYGAGTSSSVSLSTTRPESLVQAGQHKTVVRDTTVSTVPEVELAIARESTMTPMKIGVMAISGAIAGVGVLTGALHLVIGAMVIAPGFEPFSRVALGVVQRTAAWRDGLKDVALGYAALAAGGAVAAVLSAVLGAGPLSPGSGSYLPASDLVSYFSTTSWTGVAVAVIAGGGGALLLVINRRVLTAGVMIALALIPSLALAAMALVAADLPLAGRATARFLVDAVLVTVMSALVFLGQRLHDGRRDRQKQAPQDQRG